MGPSLGEPDTKGLTGREKKSRCHLQFFIKRPMGSSSAKPSQGRKPQYSPAHSDRTARCETGPRLAHLNKVDARAAPTGVSRGVPGVATEY